MHLYYSKPLRIVLLIIIMGVSTQSTLSALQPGILLSAQVAQKSEEPNPGQMTADEQEAQRVDEAQEGEKEKEKWKNIVVYTCFGLSLILLLWMRKKARAKAEGNE